MTDSSHELLVRIAVLESRLHAADEARVLQAKEYERRLSDLNHAHQQAMERNATFVSRELYDSGMREVRVLAEGAISKSDANYKELSAKVYTGVGILLAVQFLVGLVVYFWKHG